MGWVFGAKHRLDHCVIKTAGGDVPNLARSLFLFLGRLLSHLCNEDVLPEL